MNYKLIVFTPDTDQEKLKTALFAAGAGKQGEYDQCCFELKGTGQFRPSEKTNPHLGKKGIVEKVDEIRSEFLVSKDDLKTVIEALYKTHPYEEPAFDIIELVQIPAKKH